MASKIQRRYKKDDEIERNYKERWLAYFGLPKIFQADNGLEFKNKLMVNMIASWPGECKMIFNRPRHPQSNGKGIF